MARTVPALLAALLVLAPALLPAEEPVDWAVVSRIRAEGFHRSKIVETARYLTDDIGPRLTGSPQMKEANEWTRTKLAEWGLSNARLESYSFGRGWEFTRTAVHLLKPQAMPLQALPKGWTPGTEGPVRGSVVHIEALDSEEDFAKVKGKLAGKVVLLGKERDLMEEKDPADIEPRRYSEDDLRKLGQYEIPEDRSEDFSQRAGVRAKKRRALGKFLREEKVLAILEPSDRNWGVLRVGRGADFSADGEPGVTALVLAAEQFNRLARLAADEGKEIELEVDVQARFFDDDKNAYNTVAEIPGTDKKGEVVLLGAHLDSWHTGTGATDNAAGCAVVMEAVRILKAIGVKPRRTIRVALWSGEEQGLLGSTAYVTEHYGTWPEPADESQKDTPAYRRKNGPFKPSPDHAKLAAYFNLDNGSGKIRGIYAQENGAVVPIFEGWLRAVRDLGADTVTFRNTSATDHVPFDAAGLPAFQFIQDELDYSSHTHHTALDAYDHLDKEALKQAAVVMATFAYQAAMRSEPLPRKPLAIPEEKRP